MKTKITEMLGIEYPIIQGGMAWVAEHHLAAAVSEAGGLGLIGGANAPGEVCLLYTPLMYPNGVLIRYCVQIESLFWGMLEADGIFLFKLSLYVINKSQV